MHELSITRNIVAIVSEHARGRPVRRVRLQIGKLSAIMPDAIRFCFDLCVAGTLLAGARLEIEEPPGLAHCAACGAAVKLTLPTGSCPRCKADALRLSGGEEMLIKEIELDMEGASCA